jgi:hypothetical protein
MVGDVRFNERPQPNESLETLLGRLVIEPEQDNASRSEPTSHGEISEALVFR